MLTRRKLQWQRLALRLVERDPVDAPDLQYAPLVFFGLPVLALWAPTLLDVVEHVLQAHRVPRRLDGETGELGIDQRAAPLAHDAQEVCFLSGEPLKLFDLVVE